MTDFDDFLRTLLFRKFCVGKVKFDFMEALLAVCITGVGFALRTAFPDSGMPDIGYSWKNGIWQSAQACW